MPDETQRLFEAVEGMKLMLERSPSESAADFDSRKEKASLILEGLTTDDLVQFQQLIEEQKKFEGEIDETNTVQLAGAANEVLFEKQYQQDNPERIRSQLNRQMVTFISSPPEKLKNEFYQLNRPDLFDLVYDEESNSFVIQRAIEVTHGVINEHKFDQIVNYEHAVNGILAIIKAHKQELIELGMQELAENADKFRISDDFSVELVLSAEKDPEDMTTFIGDNLKNHEIDEIADMMEDTALEIRTSLFTKKELEKMGVELFRLMN